MTEYDPAWATEQEAKRAMLAERGMYLPETEHDNCGVGLVVALDGKPARKVVEAGITALKAIWHRGAVDADGKTGDGAGLHVQIPPHFFHDQIRRTGHEPDMDKLMAVGQVFLPRTDFGAQETCRTIVEAEVLAMGYAIYGWRHVPVNVGCLGEKANATRPEIEQIILANAKGVDEETFERELYVIRRRIEKAAKAEGIGDLYICSLSCRSIIYKGMMLAEQVAEFYPDLEDPRFESAFAIYHQRYSTNTFPQWWLAQPFRMLAHNGEINTLKGNINWMKSHEIRMASAAFGEMAEDIKPIVPNGSSDSAALDSVFEVMVRAGRNAPMAKTMLVPESWSKQAVDLPKPWIDMYAYCNAVMEPWDGPAALAMTDGRWVCAGMDRNGLRPMRYTVTGEGLLIAGSESGIVPVDEAGVVEKGALGPGQMIAVDMVEAKLFHDREIKDKLAASQPFGEWVGKINELDEALAGVTEAPLFEGPYKERFEKLLTRYPEKRAALLPTLALAQEVRGHVSPETMARVAELLEADAMYTVYEIARALQGVALDRDLDVLRIDPDPGELGPHAITVNNILPGFIDSRPHDADRLAPERSRRWAPAARSASRSSRRSVGHRHRHRLPGALSRSAKLLPCQLPDPSVHFQLEKCSESSAGRNSRLLAQRIEMDGRCGKRLVQVGCRAIEVGNRRWGRLAARPTGLGIAGGLRFRIRQVQFVENVVWSEDKFGVAALNELIGAGACTAPNVTRNRKHLTVLLARHSRRD